VERKRPQQPGIYLGIYPENREKIETNREKIETKEDSQASNHYGKMNDDAFPVHLA
jgi:hypothetical protein